MWSHVLFGMAAGRAQPAAAFAMDSNTGRLLPQPGSAAKSGSQADSLGGGSDLLETPPLCTAPSQVWHAPGPSRLRAAATQPSSDDAGKQVRSPGMAASSAEPKLPCLGLVRACRHQGYACPCSLRTVVTALAKRQCSVCAFVVASAQDPWRMNVSQWRVTDGMPGS